MVTHTAVGSDLQHNVAVLKEHAYGLAPMQAGMLFQALLSEAAGTSGYDIEQLHFLLREELHSEFFKQACGLAMEGIVSKRAGAPYRPGRSADWR